MALLGMEYMPRAASLVYRQFVVARVRLNRIDTDAYAQCFNPIFDAVAKDHAMLKIGVSLMVLFGLV